MESAESFVRPQLWILCLNRCPVLAVVAATCLHKGLFLAAIPRAFYGKRSDSVNCRGTDVQGVAHLPSTLSNSALTDNQNLVCSDDRGQPFLTQLINVRVIKKIK